MFSAYINLSPQLHPIVVQPPRMKTLLEALQYKMASSPFLLHHILKRIRMKAI